MVDFFFKITLEFSCQLNTPKFLEKSRTCDMIDHCIVVCAVVVICAVVVVLTCVM